MDNSQPKAPMAAQPEQDQALKAAKRREDFKNMQSRVLEMMKPENRRKPVVINSLEEFLVMNAANKSLSSSDLNVRMDGYPATDPERVALVAQLTAAITDFTDVVEKPVDENAGETTAVTTVRNLADYEVQLLAWKILIAVCDAHRGRRNIPSWPTRTVLLRKVYKSFGDRFRDVKEAVARSKGLVRNIMDSDVHYVRRLAEGPRNKLHSKKGDWQARLTKSARKGTKSKETVDESSANDDGGGGNTTSERSHGPQPPGLFNQQQFAGARDQAHVRHQPHPAWSADYALTNATQLPADNRQTFVQPPREPGMQNVGHQARGFQPMPAHHGTNTNVLWDPASWVAYREGNFNSYDGSAAGSSGVYGNGLEDDFLDPSSWDLSLEPKSGT